MLQNSYFNHVTKLFGLNVQSREVMENKEPKNTDMKIVEQKEQIIIPKVLRSEFNFLKYPFFDLSKASTRDKIEVKESIESNEGRADLVWRVSKNVEFGFPSAFDKKLYRAIEQIIDKMSKPIQNPIALGSLRSLCGLMRINPSGFNTNEVKKSLQRMVATTIQSQGTFYLKDAKKTLNDTFHLYDRVLFSGDQFPDGTVSDGIFLLVSNWYLQNINANYVVPLDWDYYQKLQGNIATRMYEYIGLFIYAALQNNRNFVQVRYSRLCDYFPLVRQDVKWKAQKQLGQAHTELLNDQYFSTVEWLDCPDQDDWLIKYYIGNRAVSEWQRNKKYFKRELESPKCEEIESPVIETKPDKSLTDELVKRKITRKVAEKLCADKPAEKISTWIDAFDYLVESNSSLIGKNPAGYLRKAIEEDWALPADFVPKEEKIRRQEQQQDVQKRFEHTQKIERYKEWLSMTDRQKVKGELMFWEIRYKKRNDRMPTTDELRSKEDELIKKLPTNEEKQIQIFGEVIYQDNELNLFD
jgi:hypothetical protein